MFMPDVEEIRLSPVVARKGYLNVLEHLGQCWKKRWVVVRRPYVFMYRDEKDLVERVLINLTSAQVEYDENQSLPSMLSLNVPNTFVVSTKFGCYLLQTLNQKELHEWLYAINPLLAGQIRYFKILSPFFF